VDAEHLAAYLAGELDADETAAVEAALARDPAVRATLEALERADTALASVPATELPAGFERRLRAAIDEELAVQLRSAESAAPAHGATGIAATQDATGDELATRRARRSRSWLPALAGAAAAVAVVAGAVVGVGVLGSGGDDAATESMMTLEADDSADGGAGSAEMLPGPGEVPTLIVGDRDLDDQLADELLASAELQAVAAQALPPEDGRSLGAAWRDAFAGVASDLEEFEAQTSDDRAGDASDDADEEADEGADADTMVEEPAAESAGPIRVLADGPVTEADSDAVRRCLDEVLSGGDGIPAYVELASYDGEPAVVIGLVTFDPASRAYSRPEIWVLDRQDCQVRRFSQG
jgi:negative regulator of sigma E activity